MGDTVIKKGINSAPKHRNIKATIRHRPSLDRTWKVVLALKIGTMITILVNGPAVTAALIETRPTSTQLNRTYSTLNVENTSAATIALMETRPTNIQSKHTYSTVNVENTSSAPIKG